MLFNRAFFRHAFVALVASLPAFIAVGPAKAQCLVGWSDPVWSAPYGYSSPLVWDASSRELLRIGRSYQGGVEISVTIARRAEGWRVLDLPSTPYASNATIVTDDEAHRIFVLRRTYESGRLISVRIGSVWSEFPGPQGVSQIFSGAFDEARRSLIIVATGSTGDGTWEHDGTQWRRLGSGFPGGVRPHALAFDPEVGRVIMHGGRIGRQEFLSTWELIGDQWVLASSGGPRLGILAISRDSQRVFLLARRERQSVSDLYERIGGLWTATGIVDPTGLIESIAWDDNAQTFIGFVDGECEETWEIRDGVTRLASVAGPCSITSQMPYSNANLGLLLHRASARPWGTETWNWNGTSWSWLASGGPPIGPSASWARTGGVILAEPIANGPLWSWNGEAWQSVPSRIPAPWIPMHLVEDPASNRLLAVSRTSSGTSLRVWAWDGENWTIATDSPALPYNPNVGAAFHLERRELVLVIWGRFQQTYRAEGWVWNGTNWTITPVTAPSQTLSYDPVSRSVISAANNSGSLVTYDGVWHEARVSYGNYTPLGPIPGTGVLGRNGGTLSVWPANDPPRIDIHPQDLLCQNHLSLSVRVGGSWIDPPVYQWRRNGVAVADGTTATGTVFSGADSTSLTFVNMSREDWGVYDFVLTTSCGTAFSEPATVRPCAANLVCDQALDSSDMNAFVESFVNGRDSRADFNADGFVDCFDYSDFIEAFEAGC